MRSEVEAAHANMEVFRSDWEEAVTVLTEAVDNIVTVHDFLAVSESHILEDLRASCIALRERDVERLTELSQSVEARTVRISEVVQAEMERYEPGLYTETVMEAVTRLRTSHVPAFVDEVNLAIEALLHPAETAEKKELIESSRQVCDGVRHVRRAVLMRLVEDHDEDKQSVSSSSSGDNSDNDFSAETMRQLPEAERTKILEKVEEIKSEQSKFEQEVGKWEDSDNQLIVLAKLMLRILLEMTDFTQGVEGPVTTSSDMIRAAQRISSVGTQLDKLARRVAEHCVQSRREFPRYS